MDRGERADKGPCEGGQCKATHWESAITRIDQRTERMEERHERVEDQLHHLHESVHGDGNGKIGLVRKFDNLHTRLGVIEKLGWMIVGAIVSSLVIGIAVAIGVR